MRKLTLLVCAGLALSLSGARAEIVNLPAAKDNTLIEDVQGDVSNGAGPVMQVGRTRQASLRRAVIAFDVAGGLPDVEVNINSVELRLNVFRESSNGAVPSLVSLHRIEADWGEGTSSTVGGSGAPATTDDATWTHRLWPDSAWSSVGGDFAAEASAEVTIDGTGFYTWTGDGLKADLEAWIQNPETNFGWLLLGDETQNQTAKAIDTRESQTMENRPVLVIDFTRIIPVDRVTWGQIKALHKVQE